MYIPENDSIRMMDIPSCLYCRPRKYLIQRILARGRPSQLAVHEPRLTAQHDEDLLIQENFRLW